MNHIPSIEAGLLHEGSARTQDIYLQARNCESMFHQYLATPRKYKSVVSDCLERFLNWTSFVDIFRSDNAVPEDLETTPEIHRLILLMIGVLRRNLELAIVRHGPEDLKGEGTVSTAADYSDDEDGCIYGIQGAIERLQRMALFIRHSTRSVKAGKTHTMAVDTETPDETFQSQSQMAQSPNEDHSKSPLMSIAGLVQFTKSEHSLRLGLLFVIARLSWKLYDSAWSYGHWTKDTVHIEFNGKSTVPKAIIISDELRSELAKQTLFLGFKNHVSSPSYASSKLLAIGIMLMGIEMGYIPASTESERYGTGWFTPGEAVVSRILAIKTFENKLERDPDVSQRLKEAIKTCLNSEQIFEHQNDVEEVRKSVFRHVFTLIYEMCTVENQLSDSWLKCPIHFASDSKYEGYRDHNLPLTPKPTESMPGPASNTGVAIPPWLAEPNTIRQPGRYSEFVILDPEYVRPRNQLARPIPDLVKDINREFPANLNISYQGNRLRIEASGPPNYARRAIHELVEEIGTKQILKVHVLRSSHAPLISRDLPAKVSRCWLVLRHHHHAPPTFTDGKQIGGSLRLGHFISNPKHLDNVINTLNGPLETPSDMPIYQTESRDLTLDMDRAGKLDASAHAGVPTAVTAETRVKVGAGAAFRDSVQNFSEFASLDTYIFEATKKYMKNSLKDEQVVSYLKSHEYTPSIFMITGLMVARAADVQSSATNKVDIHSGLEIDLPFMTDVGLELGTLSETRISSTAKRASDFVWAVSLVKISLKNFRRTWFDEPFPGGAIFENDEQDQRKEMYETLAREELGGHFHFENENEEPTFILPEPSFTLQEAY